MQSRETGRCIRRPAIESQGQIAAFLTFARCIRSHGFPSFPDPTSSGELTHQMVANAGISLRQLAVLQARGRVSQRYARDHHQDRRGPLRRGTIGGRGFRA